MPAPTRQTKALKDALARISELEAGAVEGNKTLNVLMAERDAANYKTAEVFKLREQDGKRNADLVRELQEKDKRVSGLLADADMLNKHVAELKRLNAVQDGYIQRINEDEYRHENRNSFRAGPSLRFIGGTALAESNFAERHGGAISEPLRR